MTGIFFKLGAGLCGVMIAVILAVRTSGVQQPSNSALSGFGQNCAGKAQLCWYGVVPGVTTLMDALAIFEQAPFEVNERVDPQLGHDEYVISDPKSADGCTNVLIPLDNHTTSAHLNCPGMRLGDMMAVFGKPDAVYGSLLLYHSGMILLIRSFSAYDAVEFIYLNVAAPFPDCASDWKGFATGWRYQETAIHKLNC